MEAVTFRSESVPDVLGLSEYIRATMQFCPHLAPSMRMGATLWTVYLLPSRDEAPASKCIFYAGLVHAEMLRMRRSAMARVEALHACENVVFVESGHEEMDGEREFEWPHWLLKRAYTRKAVLFGKFWKGEIGTARDGRALPIPPCHLLSVRSAIIKKDEQFFKKAHWLAPELRNAADDGEWAFSETDAFTIEVAKNAIGSPGGDIGGQILRLACKGELYEREYSRERSQS